MVKQEGSEGFLSKIYKNLFVTPADLESIENEVRTEKVLDKDGGIYNAAINKGFNLNIKGNIFSGINEVNGKRTASRSTKSKKQLKSTGNNVFNSEILNKINLNKSEVPSELGNNFDQFS